LDSAAFLLAETVFSHLMHAELSCPVTWPVNGHHSSRNTAVLLIERNGGNALV